MKQKRAERSILTLPVHPKVLPVQLSDLHPRSVDSQGTRYLKDRINFTGCGHYNTMASVVSREAYFLEILASDKEQVIILACTRISATE